MNLANINKQYWALHQVTILMVFLGGLILVGCGQTDEENLLPPLSGTENAGIQPLTIEPSTSPITRVGTRPSNASLTATPTSIPTVTLVPGAVMPAEIGSNSGSGSQGAATKVIQPTSAATDECKTCPFNNGGTNSGSNVGGTAIPPSPTAVISAADAPRFPETPYLTEFQPQEFLNHLELVRDSFRSFTNEWIPILREERERNRGDCGSYLGWYTLWVTQAPAYESVLPEWESLYIEYRVMLEQAVIVTTRIRSECPGVFAGPYSRVQDPIGYFMVAYPRLEELLLHASEMTP